MDPTDTPLISPWRRRLHEIIFEADTPGGRAFDVALLVVILLSVLVVMLESVPDLRGDYDLALRVGEWTFTVLFTVEYVLRLVCLGRPRRYAMSFFGVVDLLAILPTYLSLVAPGMQSFMVVRALRLLRIFRVLKMGQFLDAGQVLREALWASRHKIAVFMGTVVTIVLIVGALMHIIEGPENGFDSIPRGCYWAIVTLTTVGFGDITPQTVLGQILASFVMILGYGVIAVPTGIVTAAIVRGDDRALSTQSCPACLSEGHDADAKYCKRCGTAL